MKKLYDSVEGAKAVFGKSIDYKNTIHDLIPGGAHTYSKGDDQFPYLAPAAIERGEGAYVWDVDGNKFLDCAMGLTSVSLGHGYATVVDAVSKAISNGVNFQRPSHLEKIVAEEFLELVPDHDMIKFCKNGSSATTSAVKICRAKTGRKLVAFPSDMPFFSYDDWFIGKTKCAFGVPEEISALSLTYDSKDSSTLQRLFDAYPEQIACVITEAEKADVRDYTELQKVAEITRKHGALFILDEMITGFKVALPGAIAVAGVDPDLATWGKGIANGFSFCALTGKKEVMELGGIVNSGQPKLFLSSTTHGAETSGLAAFLATVREFKEKNVIDHIHGIGATVHQRLSKIVEESPLDSVRVYGKNWWVLTSYDAVGSWTDMEVKTMFAQLMIQRGILWQGTFVPCYSHGNQEIELLAEAFEDALQELADALASTPEKFLVGEAIKPVFRTFL